MAGSAGIITAVTRHRVSANVIMLIFIICGAWAISKLTVRFFPPFETNTIFTVAIMEGSNTSEIETSIVEPIENALRNVPDYKKIYSYSRDSSGTVILEFPDSVDLNKALEDVKAEVDRVSLPADAEVPTTSIAEFSIHVSKLAVVGDNATEVRQLARRLENEINALGIGKVSVSGVAEQDLLILADQRKLLELGMTVAQVGGAIGSQNSDASVGSISGIGSERKLRADSKSSEFADLLELPITSAGDGDTVYVRDVASGIRRENGSNQITALYAGRPAAELLVQTSGDGNILDAAAELNDWVAATQARLPPGIELVAYDEEWRNVSGRLNLLIDNGKTGMMLVIGVLFLFLSFWVAFWVAIGIPVAMLGTLFVFELLGGTINMISMFALIMAVGIIVDDAIVVGENAQYRFSKGEPPMRAVTSAARNMFVPVFASSSTTVSAFLPLFLVTGPIGAIIFDIPLIIVCILIAALIECFLVLPGHLYFSFARRGTKKTGFVRRRLNSGFDTFRERIFRPAATFAVRHALATVATCFMLLAISFSLLGNGLVNYRFFPGAEGNRMYGNLTFSSGTPRATVEAYVGEMLVALEAAAAELEPEHGPLLAHVVAKAGQAAEPNPAADNSAVVFVELIDVDKRSITVSEFTDVWRSKLDLAPGVVQLDLVGESSGPPGRDIEVRLTSDSVGSIKTSAEQVKRVLATINGVKSVSDDTPFGKEEIIFELTALGQSLNMDVQDVASQLRHALDGFRIQSFTEGVDEIDLKIKLADFEDNAIGALLLRLPSGQYAPLRDIVTWRTQQGFDTVLHQQGQPAITVQADLDPDAPVTVGEVLAELEDAILRELYQTEGVSYSFEGKNADEAQTAKEMGTGLVLALILIFIILTWVFNSWTLPLVVMLTMPMGVIGTIFGHWFLGVTMSILSFFGMFTLMGILVNNSIVLIDCFKGLGVDNKDADTYNAAIVEAACLRLRAVILTSLTTIFGLLPLMFETSLQAQFLIPMAISIVFGLAFSSMLILFFSPACLALHGSLDRAFQRLGRLDRRLGGRFGWKTAQQSIK